MCSFTKDHTFESQFLSYIQVKIRTILATCRFINKNDLCSHPPPPKKNNTNPAPSKYVHICLKRRDQPLPHHKTDKALRLNTSKPFSFGTT